MGALAGAIVAVDPGCLHTGVVYMDERRVLDSCTIAYPKGVSGDNDLLDERCEAIWHRLERFLASHPHDLVVVEGYRQYQRGRSMSHQTPWLCGALLAHLHEDGEAVAIQMSAKVLNPRSPGNCAWVVDCAAQGREVLPGSLRLVTNEHLRSALAHGVWWYQRHGDAR